MHGNVFDLEIIGPGFDLVPGLIVPTRFDTTKTTKTR